MSHLSPIYAVWDHNAEMLASDINEPGVKVRQWRNRNNIPPAYWQRIIAAAERRGVALDHVQFIRPASEDDAMLVHAEHHKPASPAPSTGQNRELSRGEQEAAI